MAQSYDPVRRNISARRAGAVGPKVPTLTNDYAGIYDVEIEGTPKYTNAGWDVKVKVSNYTPLYLSMVRGKWDGYKGNITDKNELLDYLVKPANTTDFVKAMGTKGFHDMVEKQKQFWNHIADINDIYNSDTSYDYIKAWKESDPWNKQTATVPMRLENHDDVMMVVSPKDNDVMLLYNYWQIVFWPWINIAFKENLPSYQKKLVDGETDKEKTLEMKLCDEVFKTFIKNVNADKIAKLRRLSKEGSMEVLSELMDIAEEAALEYIKEKGDDILEDMMEKVANGTMESLTSGYWHQLLVNNESFHNTLEYYKDIGKHGSMIANIYMYLDFANSLDTYAVRFNLDDTTPVTVEVKTSDPLAIINNTVIIPIEIKTNSFITECGVVYTDNDNTPSLLDGNASVAIDPCYSGQVTLSYLKQNQKYRARAYAKIDQGFADGQTLIYYGDVIEFTTGTMKSRQGDIVDLGVSVYWSDCNMGASTFDGVGSYVAWGETTTKTSFSLSNYTLCDAGAWKYSPIDNKTTLTSDDDMARVIWEDGWRIPSRAELQELVDKCDWSDWTTSNGTPGRFVYNRSDHSKYIFLPAAGYFKDNNITYFGETGYYWSRERSTEDFKDAYYLLMSSSEPRTDLAYLREYGRQLRPVKDKPFLEADPAVVDFGDVEVGSSKKVSIKLRNKSSSSVAISIPYSPYISPECPSQTVISAGGAYSIDFYYVPQAEETIKTAAMITYVGANSADYTLTIPIMGNAIAKTEPEQPGGDFNGHECVDLGLPSGLKWATCNVGANSPEEYGDYFAWGETSPKENYSWETYKWCNGTYNSMTKYCTTSDHGTIDNKTVLDLSDDAAHVNWGGSWRMPTSAEQDELREKCTWTWTTQNGVKGRKVTGPNGNSIFLPAAGSCYGTNLDYAGSYSNGRYWSSSLYTLFSHTADGLDFYSSGVGWYSYKRYAGFSVRPVCQCEAKPQATCSFSTSSYTLNVGGTYTQTVTTNSDGAVTYTSSNPSVVSVDASTGKVTAVSVGNATITATVAATGTYASSSASYDISVVKSSTDHGYVDLGLSVKWATCNVGANSPEEYGDYFAWGETNPKEDYSWNTYKWTNEWFYMTKYCTDSSYGTVDNKIVLDLSDDAAHVNWGGSWRMPTKAEQDELREKCTWTWITQDGAKGYKVTGPNGNSIFLPAAGDRYGADLNYAGGSGSYWSSSLYTSSSSLAYVLTLNSWFVYCTDSKRYYGQSVRAVCP